MRRRRVYQNESAWFLFNPTRATVDETVPVESFQRVTDLLRGPMQLHDRQVNVSVGPLDINCLILKS